MTGTDSLARPDVRADMNAAAELIRRFRQELLDAGFRHANGAGELVSKDDVTWVATSYTHGEYSIHVWFRPRGHGELHETRWVLRVHNGEKPAETDTLASVLVPHAKKHQSRRVWPPRKVELTVSS